MSAVLGLIGIAPRDQFEVPLKVSEIGTLGAPVRLLPVAVTAGGSIPETVVRFHCETCGPETATVWLPPVASVSRIIPLITLGTSNCELAPAAPSTEAKDPSGTVWSTPVNVVAPATTPPLAAAVGIFTVTVIATLAPEAGFSRYHISTRRVSAASLFAPIKLRAVPP